MNPLSRIQVDSIFLPTDFSEASQAAFYHALKIALASKATLNLLHVSDHDDITSDHDFPQIRETLARWKVLPAESTKNDVNRLGLGVVKAAIKSGNVSQSRAQFSAGASG